MILAALAALAFAVRVGAEGPLIAPPTGYAPVDGMKAPAVAIFAKTLWDGEVTLAVERHEKQSGAPALEAFVRQLGAPAVASKRKIGRRVFQLYEDIPVETVTRRLGDADPYAAALGTDVAPPRLSLLEGRRFPLGGEAYRLYRCREKGAWSLLGGYAEARASGRGAEYAATRPEAAGLVPACFGASVWGRMQRGEAVEDIPKPWMYRLRIMARDEWASGAVRRYERETVYLSDAPDAIWAVRYRAPERAYRTYRGDFLRFLAGLELP